MARISASTWITPTSRLAGKLKTNPLKKIGGKSFWALLDQACSSAGNFATNILLARQLAAEHFGTFGLLLEAIFFLNALQAALVIYPLSVRGASSSKQTLSRFTTISLLITLALAIPVVGAALIAGAITSHMLLAISASLALVAWQVQETLRRALHSHMRHCEAVWGDSISYIGQAVCIAVLIPMHSLNLESIFAMLALTSAAAAMVQLFQVGLVSVTFSDVWDRAKEFFSYGRYLATTNLTVVITVMSYSWVLTLTHGTAAAAGLFAMLTMLKPVSPIVNGIVTLIVPAAARVNEEKGPSAAGREAARFGMLGAAMLVPYLAVMITMPETMMRFFLGSGSNYLADGNVLRLYVAQASIMYAVATVSSYFNAIHHSRLSLLAQLVNAGSTILLSLPLVWIGGLPCAAAGSLVAAAAQLAMLMHFRTKIQLRIPHFEQEQTRRAHPTARPTLRKAA